MSEVADEATVEKLAKIYAKIRDKRKELEKEVAELKEKQDVIAKELLELCKEQGVTTMRTAYGTVSKRVTKNYWTSDWESFYKFIKENDAFSLMQQRINNTNMAQFLSENPDVFPPGLNADTNQTIVIVKR
jgi:hypothetical protein